MTSRRAAAALLAAVVAVLAAAPAAAVTTDGPRVLCRFTDTRLAEISGITWSATHPGVWWVHNDSGRGPYLYAIDGTTCRTLARIRVGGIGARDLEAIATGVDPKGRRVLWLADIGDNRDSWPSVRLHAVVEPTELVDQQVSATTYRFTYSDGPHNAEGIIADPRSASVWVVTKQLARGAVWSVPLRAGSVAIGSRVGEVGGLVTDAAMSPDGSRYVIRDYVGATLHDAPVTAGSLAAGTPVVLPGQRQGEAVSFTPDGTALVVASEGEDALWLVPLAASESASSTPSPSASDEPGSSSSASASASPELSPGGGAGRVVLAALLVGAAAAIAVVASRRLRR